MNALSKEIYKIAPGKPFTVVMLRELASYANVRQTLSRLAKTGEITRISRGIFVRPKKIPYLGKVLPESRSIVDVIAKKSGETIATHGAEAARILQLSTQVPMKSIYYTTGSTRRIKIENHEIVLTHISAKKIVMPGTMVGLAISALWYLGKNHVNNSIIEKIKKKMTQKQFSELLNQTIKMPAWMADFFYQYKQEKTYAK